MGGWSRRSLLCSLELKANCTGGKSLTADHAQVHAAYQSGNSTRLMVVVRCVRLCRFSVLV